MLFYSRIIKGDGLGRSDRLVITGGHEVSLGIHGHEFATKICITFWPPPSPEDEFLEGGLQFPEIAEFEFSGTLARLEALIRESEDWLEILDHIAVEVWR